MGNLFKVMFIKNKKNNLNLDFENDHLKEIRKTKGC